MRTLITTIIVTYNSAKFLRECLCPLSQDITGVQHQIVLIDNNSRDDSVKIALEFPKIRLIRNKRNFGLSYALNQGITSLAADYYFILNPDAIMTKEAALTLLNFMENQSEAGIAAPKLLYPDGRLQYSCRRFPTPLTFLARGVGLSEKRSRLPAFLKSHLMMDFDHQENKEVDWVLGAAMLIRQKTISQIGYFDDKMPLYYGDVDLCFRAKKAGWRTFYVPGTHVTHNYQRESAGGNIFNPLKWSHAKSALRFFAKKYGFIQI